MKAVIFCGGFGSRLSEHTKNIPKPLVPLGSKPILLELIETLNAGGVEDFYLALGYKAHEFKNYFRNMRENNSDIKIDFKSGEVSFYDYKPLAWRVHLIDTGYNTMTGGRLKRISSFIGDDDNFIVTYGDGLANVNAQALMDYHIAQNAEVTITAVRPDARFGRLKVEKNKVKDFTEKQRLAEGWINGGFMVVNKSFINRISGDETVLEEEPLSSCARDGRMSARFHSGFWQCMDTKRDHEMLEKIVNNSSKVPWKTDLV